jgi:hypothetical protein
MKAVKLNKKAQNIVNQIMSSDAIEIIHGPITHLVTIADITLDSEGLKCYVEVDGDAGEVELSNDVLNYAEIIGGSIIIDSEHIKENHYNNITIQLFKLTSIAAIA